MPNRARAFIKWEERREVHDSDPPLMGSTDGSRLGSWDSPVKKPVFASPGVRSCVYPAPDLHPPGSSWQTKLLYDPDLACKMFM